MDNQDQYNQEVEESQESIGTEFSARRRIFTAVLVLVAALLLGYVIYMMMFSQNSSNQPAEAPTNQPGLSAEEQAIQRLQAFEQAPAVPASAAELERLESFMNEDRTPSQQQLDRLEQLKNRY